MHSYHTRMDNNLLKAFRKNLQYSLKTVKKYRLSEAGVAQLVERVTRNHQVEGSNPSAGSVNDKGSFAG